MDSLFFKEHLVKISKFFSTSSTGWHPVQLVHRVSLYGALILVILEPNSYMAWAHGLQISFGLYFGPYFGFLAAHHESIWILGGEASWKLKIVSLHREWGGELMGKLIPRLTGALSRAWRREKRRGFDGGRSGTIKEEKKSDLRGLFIFLRGRTLWNRVGGIL